MLSRACVLNQNLCGGGKGGVVEAHIFMTSPVPCGLLPASFLSIRNAAHLFVGLRPFPIYFR